MTDNATQRVLLLENVRTSYLYAFRPYTGTNDQGQATSSYTCHTLMEPNHPGIQLVKQATREIAAAAWGEQGMTILNALAAKDYLCLHDGNVTKVGEEAYANKFYVSANGKTRPRICVTRNGQNVEIQENDPCAPYSGCWANVLVAIYAQGANGKPSKWGKRINAQFMGIQFQRHDTRFGGGRIAKLDEFGIAPAEADGAVPMQGAAAGGAASSLV